MGLVHFLIDLFVRFLDLSCPKTYLKIGLAFEEQPFHGLKYFLQFVGFYKFKKTKKHQYWLSWVPHCSIIFIIWVIFFT